MTVTGADSEPSRPETDVRPKSNMAQIISAGAACVTLVVALVSACVALAVYFQNVERDQRTAAVRICETYATDSYLARLTDEIWSRASIRQSDGSYRRSYKSSDFSPAIANELKPRLIAWANFFSLVSIGMEAEVYSRDIIGQCMGSVFEDMNKVMLGPDDTYFLPRADWPEIQRAIDLVRK